MIYKVCLMEDPSKLIYRAHNKVTHSSIRDKYRSGTRIVGHRGAVSQPLIRLLNRKVKVLSSSLVQTKHAALYEFIKSRQLPLLLTVDKLSFIEQTNTKVLFTERGYEALSQSICSKSKLKTQNSLEHFNTSLPLRTKLQTVKHSNLD